jgi:tRNA nucleotidyltransferase/poly(A) polymerase
VKHHHKFSSALVKLPSGVSIDVATARLEYYPSPAALPCVELSSLKMDLYRRDFTINAMVLACLTFGPIRYLCLRHELRLCVCVCGCACACRQSS